ncbi:MAG TPA: xanthine phosphoribosyltransferase [Holosporales bacterium]|nr:xanthine phosphoribosyltransferase [Holosporales bacterium]
MKLFSIFLLTLSTFFCSVQAKEPSSDGKHYISWEDVAKNSKDLAEKLKDQGPFEGIVAVARGGYIPAVIVAHELNIKKIVSFSLYSYDDAKKKQGEFDVYSKFEDLEGRWLVIDELVDSGKTLAKIRESLPKSVFAVVYAKPAGTESTDFYAKAVPQDTWVVLPWEN